MLTVRTKYLFNNFIGTYYIVIDAIEILRV